MAPMNTPNPPTASQSTRMNNRKTTANKPLLSISKSNKDHVLGTGIRTDVNSINSARKILATHGLILLMAGNMLQPIATALFKFSISANLGVTHIDILRAMAFVLFEIDREIDVQSIVQKIQALMGGPVATLDEKVDELEKTIEKHKSALEYTATEVSKQLNSAILNISQASENATAVRHNTPTSHRDVTEQRGQRSYAAATKEGIPTPLVRVLARSEAQACQILIERRSLNFTNMLINLTEIQLVTKANLAVEAMTKEDTDIPQNIKFLSARCLPQGGVLYELDSTESAAWFRTPSNHSKFLDGFGIEVAIRDRAFHVIVENVPISFIPENQAALSNIEQKAGMRPQAIMKARYIKPVNRRNPGQCTAHIILTFNTKESANQAIKFGLTIAGKKVYARKLIAKPSRCLKCHSFDGSHKAAECQQEFDMCGTCTRIHRTSACTITDQNFFCANCNAQGHTAWDRNCPTFIQKWDDHKNRHAETKYRFYPTEDPLTWERIMDANFE
jgi:hypothetical protein